MKPKTPTDDVECFSVLDVVRQPDPPLSERGVEEPEQPSKKNVGGQDGDRRSDTVVSRHEARWFELLDDRRGARRQ
jgi:hypothetical protein